MNYILITFLIIRLYSFLEHMQQHTKMNSTEEGTSKIIDTVTGK